MRTRPPVRGQQERSPGDRRRVRGGSADPRSRSGARGAADGAARGGRQYSPRISGDDPSDGAARAGGSRGTRPPASAAKETGREHRISAARPRVPGPAPCPGRGRERRGMPQVPNLYCPRNPRRPPWQTHHPRAALARGSRSRVSGGRSARCGPVTEARLPEPAATHSRPRAAAAPARARRPRSPTAGMCGLSRRPPGGRRGHRSPRGTARGASRPAAPGRGETGAAR